MTYLEFRDSLRSFSVFSYPDIRKLHPAFDRRRLVEWQQKNYVRKLRNGYYTFSDIAISESTLLHISNTIYKPSYISLESALSYYNLIPEAVYLITSITTRKTAGFENSLAHFSYRNIKSSLFFGYNLVEIGAHTIRIADPEKAMLDTLYLNKINTREEVDALRLNIHEAQEIIDPGKMNNYLRIFESGIMEERVHHFLDYIDAQS
jgi:predicted transcriptional regulator of viral defense system